MKLGVENNMQSIWTESSQRLNFKSLKGDVKTDVLIIGGGMAGILIAYFLEQAGVDYMLVEGKTIGDGITKNTTAKITSQHGLIYDKLIHDNGVEKAKQYLDANQLALKRYKEICENIDCDFEEKSAYTYSLSDRIKIEREIKAVYRLGLVAEFIEDLPLPFKTCGAIEFKNQAQFHPLKFINAIAKNLNIYENTFIKELGENAVITNAGKIIPQKIIVATHFPVINKHGMFFLKMYQHRSYVIALEDAQNIHGMYVDEAQEGMSFRNYKNLLFIGGGDHRTGEEGGNWKELRGFARKYYPNAIERYAWATQDCMTLDGIPYIGEYATNTPNLYVATGFNKWGMTSSMISAIILSDMIIGRDNPFEELFSPNRSMLKPQLLLNGVAAVVNLLKPKTKRCPHLGCALTWNKVEQTWDCPCHGSRFEKNGDLIDNPATGSLKK